MNLLKEADGGVKFFIALPVVIIALLSLRLWQLQIMEHKTYLHLAQINSAKTMPLIAPRGIIYDKDGKILVFNKAVFSAYILPSGLRNKEYVIRKLSSVISIPSDEIVIKLRQNRSSPFNPILIRDDIPIEIVAKLEEQIASLPGVIINTKPVRIYPYKSLAAHVLGYVGEVNASDLDNNSDTLSPGDLIGKAGIEKVYDAYLRGINGGQRVAIDAFGKDRGIQKFEDSIPGKNIYLTIDIDIQKAADEALGSNSGAVVVINPNNGNILALASHPSYDPNIFAHPIPTAKWKKLYSSGHPFLNRALSTYPPGSTFKVISLSLALDNDLSNPDEKFFCPGFFQLGKRIAKCWKLEGHKNLGLLDGLVHSCDIVFYKLGLRENPDILGSYAEMFGLGKRTGIDLPSESKGIVPSAKWKEKRFGEKWFPGDSINYAIGQGFLWVTPLQMAHLYSSIGIGGVQYLPHVISQIKDRSGQSIYSFTPRITGELTVKQHTLSLIQNTLHEVVKRGTGRAAHIPSFEAAGKTGTAENPKHKPHAWFVCYAPDKNPEVAIAAFVEYGMHGDQVTAKIARHILEKYYDKIY